MGRRHLTREQEKAMFAKIKIHRHKIPKATMKKYQWKTDRYYVVTKNGRPIAYTETKKEAKKWAKRSTGKYQIRGTFPTGDMIFDNKADAITWQKKLREQGYQVDNKIYDF